MTHAELVDRAARWLRNARVHCEYARKGWTYRRCGVVATESQGGSEIADAIGFTIGGRASILIECKASRADFRRDSKKLFRAHPKNGMGCYRYYLTPRDMITTDDIPERWGLIETHGKIVRVLQYAAWQNRNLRSESEVLYRAARLREIEK